MKDLIAMTVMFSCMAVAIFIAVVHGAYKAQEIQEAWRKLADRHRLRYEPKRSLTLKTKVTGSLAGRPFVLRQSGSGNKTAMEMELELHGPLPGGLRMKRCGKHLAAHREVLGVPLSEVIESSGEVKINEEVSVTAADPAELPTYLTAERQRGALRLADIGGEFEDKKLRVTVTKMADDLEMLDEAVRTLAAVAPMLDAA